MKIVIDISEKTVNEIKDNVMFAGAIPSKILWDVTSAIVNGTPLPKGYGRIIDESQVVGTFTWDNGFIECFAPTIIEADKGESENAND